MGEPVVTEPQEALKTGTSSGRRQATRRRSPEYERRQTMADRHRDNWRESSRESYWRDRDRDRAPSRRVFDPQTGESHSLPYEGKDRYIITHKVSEPPTFRGYGITEYLEKWELHASRSQWSEEKIIKNFLFNVDPSLGKEVKEARPKDGKWTTYKKNLVKLYKLEDNKYFIKDLETITQDGDESVRAFGMRFQKISDVLMKKRKISEVERCTIFIGHLSKGRQKNILRDLPRDKLDFPEVLKLAIKAMADDYKDLVWKGMRRRDLSLYKEYATDRCLDLKDYPWSEKNEAVAEEVKEIRDMVKGLTRQVTKIVTTTGATAYWDKPGGPYSLRWDRMNTDSWRSVEDSNPRTLTNYRARERERDNEPWGRKDDEIDRDRRTRETYGRARRLDDYSRSPRYEPDGGRGNPRGRWESDQDQRDGYRDGRYARSDRDRHTDDRYERSDRDGHRNDRYERMDRDEYRGGKYERGDRPGDSRGRYDRDDRRDDSRERYDRGDRRADSRGRYDRGHRHNDSRGRYDRGDRRDDSRERYEHGDRRNDSRDRNERGGYGASTDPYPKSPDPRVARGSTSRSADNRPPTPRNSCVYCRGDDHIKRDCPDLKRAIDEGLIVLDDRKYVKWADDLGDVSMFPSMKENVEASRVKSSKGKETVRSQSIKITFEGDIATTPIRVAATKSARGSTSKKTDTDYVMAEKDGQRIEGEEVIISPRKRGVKKFLMKSSLGEIDTVKPLRRALQQPMQCSILEYLAASKPARDELQMITRKTRVPLSEEAQGAPKAEAPIVAVTMFTARADRMATVLLDGMEGVPPDKFYILGSGTVEAIINDGAVLDVVVDNGSEAVIIDEGLVVQVGLGLDRSYLFEIDTTDGRKQQITGVCHKAAIEVQGVRVTLPVFAVKNCSSDLPLGRTWLSHVHAVTIERPDGSQTLSNKKLDGTQQRERVIEILKTCDKAIAFSEAEHGRVDPRYAKPARIYTIPHVPWNDAEWKYAQKEKEEVIAFLKEKMVSHVAAPSHSACANRWFFLRKPNGKIRWIQDLQKVNAVTIRDVGSVPHADLLAKGRSIYSVCDLFSGYDEVPLDPRDRHLTAMHTPLGLMGQPFFREPW
ncbi:hypothetical protein CBR_g8397 [Chara braunii]|uniref:Reverse transcriptase domain-containing protein n=1 Tax=Chara braunii TaxID=69332 RepID=A0A388KM76_CHABU|nr:hypothetical protein CBR_g8397 [Chara braunii]|eukprot:GBG71098.1 hypothetical protein CBR_g8397 [Chara braunii]